MAPVLTVDAEVSTCRVLSASAVFDILDSGRCVAFGPVSMVVDGKTMLILYMQPDATSHTRQAVKEGSQVSRVLGVAGWIQRHPQMVPRREKTQDSKPDGPTGIRLSLHAHAKGQRGWASAPSGLPV